MTTLNRDAILAADDYFREYVDMPEWGGGVYVRALSAAAGLGMANRPEADEMDQATANIGWLLVKTVVDENGQPIFTNDDIPALMGKSKAAIDRLMTVAMRVNGMGSFGESAEKN